MPLEPGQSVGHYRIVRQIGKGGMGAVFLAEDRRLQRKVALKVLPPELAADAARLERFRREAQAVASLNHPHIVTIYSVEEEDDTHFITMELVDGKSLDHRPRAPELPMQQVLDIGIALADALAAVHEKGIIHRDLKPANVMLTADGRVKVLDFGLAKVPAAAEGSPGQSALSGSEVTSAPTAMPKREDPLTTAGTMMGTVPYMSPEQVNGDSVDARTDLYSLGVVLYELAAGRRPFAGRTSAEVISSILRDVAPSVTEARPDAPPQLARIIDRCLQKDPEARFQTAMDLRHELRALHRELDSAPSVASGVSAARATAKSPESRRWPWAAGSAAVLILTVSAFWILGHRPRQSSAGPQTGAPSSGSPFFASVSPDSKTIAVLPFVNTSSDSEQEYFSDGISEALLDLLAKIPQLRVTSRTSAFSFKGKNLAIPEIARRLHVAYVLEGSVRKSGDQVRIAAQLIKADSDAELWSQTYDRKLDDIFAIQDQIAADVVKQLQVTLLGAAPGARQTDPEAYALFLQGVQLGRQHTAEGIERSDADYRKVLEIDPRYAPAWNGLATNSVNKASLGLLSGKEAFDHASEAAGKALEIDPRYARAHAGLGRIAMYRGDFPEAVRHVEQALELEPTDLIVLQIAAALLRSLGRHEDALAIVKYVVDRDPVNVTALTNLGVALASLGRLREAIDSFHTVMSLSPGYAGVHYQTGVALLRERQPEGALEEFRQETSELWRRIGLPMSYHALGRNREAQAALADLIEKHQQDAAYNIAYVLAFCDDADRAFEWLDKAADGGDSGLAEIPGESLFAGIQKDPRWLPFLRRIGKAPEQLAAIHFKVTLPGR